MKRLIILACVSLVAALLYVHPFFRVKAVSIMNGQFTDKSEMMAFFESVINRNMIWTRWSPTLKKRTLNAFSKLENIQFEWGEDGTLNVFLTEKTPWVLFMEKGHVFVGAEDGTILTHQNEFYESENYKKLVVVQNIPSQYFKQDALPHFFMTRISSIVESVRHIFPDMTFQISFKIMANAIDQSPTLLQTILFMDDVLPIYLGEASHLVDQLRRLEWIFDKYPKKQEVLEYIDLRVPGKVFVKPLK